MKRSLFLLLILVCALQILSCAKKKKAIEPPTEPTPTATATPPVEPVPPPSRPAPPPKRSLEAPPLKPRAASPGDVAALKLVQKGVQQMNAGDLDSAEEIFEQALRVSPTNGRPYYYLGVIAVKEKEFDRSLGFLTQAEAYLGNEPFWLSQVLVAEGQALKGLARIKEARSKFQDALRKDPTNKSAQAELHALGD